MTFQQYNRPKHIVMLFALTLSFVFILSACVSKTSPPTPTRSAPFILSLPSNTPKIPTVEPTAVFSETPIFLPTAVLNTPTPPVPVTPTNLVSPTATPIVSYLAPQAPWLLVQTKNGLIAINADGTGVTRLTDKSILAPSDLRRAVSADGSHVAFINYDTQNLGLALNLIALPDIKSETIALLTKGQSTVTPGSLADEATRAITYDGMAWSPQGNLLAIAGTMDGNTTDIYLYVPANKTTARLTSGPSQAYFPRWSPDGKYVVHLGADSFGTGAGYTMAGAWAVRFDGTEVIDLPLSASSGESIIGFTSPTSLIIYSWDQACGATRLRTVDITNKFETLLFEKCFNSAAADDKGNTLYTVGNSSDASAPAPGTYFIPTGQTNSTYIDPNPAKSVTWLPESKVFLVQRSSGSPFFYDPDTGESHQAPIENVSNLMLAVQGDIWAWTSSSAANPGVWIGGRNMETIQVSTLASSHPAWNQYSDLIFFSGNIYITRAPAYIPQPLERIEGQIVSIAWVGK